MVVPDWAYFSMIFYGFEAFRAKGLGLYVFGLRVLGLGFRVSGFGVWGFGV